MPGNSLKQYVPVFDQYVLVFDKQGSTFVVPVPGNLALSDFRDMIEFDLNVDTRGTVTYMSLTELRRRAKAGEME